jgi:HD superfamily phosphohydrolase
MKRPKPQRIRDPIHNLIEFGSDQFESTLWRVVESRPFQRLRRIRQLGFSEFVFPGATHTRFAHSIGVFHTARQLMGVIRRYADAHPDQQFKDIHANYAIAAALLHDVGHGMFSHAFEAVGKEFGWSMARHEEVSRQIITNSEIAEILNAEFGQGYAENVATIIAQGVPNNLYGSVVSSQFDADRLDYMQRDRMMTGVQSSGIDLTWLLANLEVAEVALGADEAKAGTIETLVLGPKAIQAAESYVLALFHLYPNVYLHKATRGAEVLFQALMRRLVALCADGSVAMTGLPATHPVVKFIADPRSLDCAMELDDGVFWGALPMLAEANEREVKKFSTAIRERKLLKCFDLRERVDAALPAADDERAEQRQARIKLNCDEVVGALKEQNQNGTVRFFIDQYSRHPYRRFQESKTPLNQILIRVGDGPPRDLGEFSPIIAHAEPFYVCRAYIFRDDSGAEGVIENTMRTKVKGNDDGGA